MKRSTIIAIIVVLTVIILAVNATRLRAPTQDIPESGSITVTGNAVCLPKRGVKPGQLTTMECAYGLLADGGVYYDIMLPSGEIFADDFDQRLRVKGIFTINNGNTMYDTIGTIEVSSIEPL